MYGNTIDMYLIFVSTSIHDTNDNMADFVVCTSHLCFTSLLSFRLFNFYFIFLCLAKVKRREKWWEICIHRKRCHSGALRQGDFLSIEIRRNEEKEFEIAVATFRKLLFKYWNAVFDQNFQLLLLRHRVCIVLLCVHIFSLIYIKNGTFRFISNEFRNSSLL